MITDNPLELLARVPKDYCFLFKDIFQLVKIHQNTEGSSFIDLCSPFSPKQFILRMTTNNYSKSQKLLPFSLFQGLFVQKHKFVGRVLLLFMGLLFGQIGFAQTAPSDDFDGDGIINSLDIDDDNDGVLDFMEQNCPIGTWTDWTSVTGNTSATGTLALTSGNVTVTYTSPQVYSIQQPGFFNLNDVYNGTMPNSGTEGLQALHGAGTTHTYTFSQPVTNPILVFWSMNGNTFTFTQDFAVIGKTANITVNNANKSITGAASECNATIQLRGTYTSISYTSSLLENWTGVTVGIQQCTDIDSDGDLVVNRFDLDSDGDGCSDAFEAGATTSKTANYQFSGSVGTNGLLNTLETYPENGELNYTSTYNYAASGTQNMCIDSDNDGVADVVDLDDDNDGVPDLVENQCPTYAAWTDWTSLTAYSSATGTLPLSTGNVTVTYTSPQVASIQNVAGSYFNIGDAYGGTMPPAGVEGLQALHGAGTTHTYTFSQPVTNPILVFWSMNGNTFIHFY